MKSTENDIVIKDVCLLPDPGWRNVPRHRVKETLVKQNMHIDAMRIKKSSSEESLQKEI